MPEVRVQAVLGAVHGLRNLPGDPLQEGLHLRSDPGAMLHVPHRSEASDGSDLRNPMRAGKEDRDLQRV
jgi:hypothetical protein